MADQGQFQASMADQKRAKGVFPRLPLIKALELPTAIYELGHGDEVRRRTVFDRLGRSPDSGSSRALAVAANSGYELIIGSYQSDYLGLTEKGMTIVAAIDEKSKHAAIFRSLFDNEIFRSFVERYKEKPLPIDEVAIDYLKKNHSLTEADAKNCWEIFKKNIIDFHLIEELSGKNIVVDGETALRHFSERNEGILEDGNEQPAHTAPLDHKPAEKPVTIPKNGLSPQFTFNIQIVIPENATKETYDSIFKSIAEHLLNRSSE